jgi:hypothetical protein
MSFNWFKTVLIDNEKTVLHIFFGEKVIGDKCYVKIGEQRVNWFISFDNTRDDIVNQGINILKSKLKDKTVLSLNGDIFSWN